MLNFVDTDAHQVQLSQAILMYGSSSSTSYATLHEIRHSGSGANAEIDAGIPLSISTLAQMMKMLTQSSGCAQGILPANVLSVGADHLVWYVPQTVQTMFFNCSTLIGERVGAVVQPTLIFSVSRSGWHVFSIKTRSRPTARTCLYNAPYMNVWEDGKICVGSTPTPRDTVATTVAQWTQAFFASNFSHTNHTKTVDYWGGCYAFWQKMLDDKPKRFPNGVLVKRRLTLGQFVAQLEGGEA